jgi:deazaflavin-dependent oxidoreductase (nitroreductase family)
VSDAAVGEDPAGFDGAAAVYFWGVAGRLLFRALVKVHVALYRASGGRLGGRVGNGVPVLLLTTTGRKTGKRRTTPLLYVEEGDRYVVVASVGGAPSHPAWYLNLRSNPAATMQVGGRKLAVTAETAGLEERARLWLRLTQMWPQYDDYQAKTRREIPVVILAPSAA